MTTPSPQDFEKMMSSITDPLRMILAPHEVINERIAFVAEKVEKLRIGLGFIDDDYIQREPLQARVIRDILTQAIKDCSGKVRNANYSLDGLLTPEELTIHLRDLALLGTIDIYRVVVGRINGVLGE